jgi:hypothetical protein
MKGLVLNNTARDRFLDWLFDDLWQALTRIIRITEGDYSSLLKNLARAKEW